MNNNFWELIDAVCVINLDHREDRWNELHEELRQFIPAEKIHRIPAVWGKKLPSFKKHRLFRGCNEEEALFWAGRAGCALSHANAIRHAQSEGWSRVMILEDDALFLDTLHGRIGEALANTMEKHANWDMIFPGMEPYDNQGVLLHQVNDEQERAVSMYQILGPLNAHCYVVNNSCYASMLRQLPKDDSDVWHWVAMNLSYDSWIANDIGKSAQIFIIGLYPIICVQRDSYSDIEHVRRDSARGALGHGAFPITEVDSEAFMSRYSSPSFILKKMMKIGMHYALGALYYLIGFRKFKVSVAKAGYWGAAKAAFRDLRKRKK